ncbi:MAG: AEC family transporter [Clostridiales bacterium]|nr:AEC family transporter [Clostridiales bacterium]
MDSLIYSLNATMPVFLIMVVGYFLRRCKMLGEGFIKSADKFNFKVTLPAMLFIDLASSNIRETFDLKYAVLCAGITTVMFFGLWIGAKLFIRDKSMVGAFVQAGYRSSVAVLGLAFILNIYGEVGMAPVMIIGCVPLYNVFAVIVLTFEADSENGKAIDNIKKSLIQIIKNPIIIAIVLGVAAALINLHLPKIIEKTISGIGSLASPLTLITIGAAFEGRKAIKKLKPTIAASIIKLVVLPGIFLPIAVYFGYRDQALMALIIMLGSPTTPSSYIMAKNMDNDYVLTSSVIVTTTLLSALTLTFWIFIARYMGYVI